MKQVILIGDSIRMGYQETVRQELKDEAVVWAPGPNGGNSRNVLENLVEWTVERKPDLIHINCGLHDLKTEFGEDHKAVSPEEYAENVEKILQILIRDTSAKVIWAQTTPVNESWHHERKGFDRFEADVIAYNALAKTKCDRVGVPIHTLYDVVIGAGRDGLLVQDGVHFTEEGSAILGRAVAETIRSNLN